MSDDRSTSPLSEASELDDEYDHDGIVDDDADESESEEDEEVAEDDDEQPQQEEDSDESDSDGEYSRHRGLLTSLHEAIDWLHQRRPAFAFILRLRRRRGVETGPGDRVMFARFVSALQRHGTIQHITFVKTRFDELLSDGDDTDNDDTDDDEGRLDKDDMDRLFGSVLPNHPTLRDVRFENCDVPSRYIQMLAGGLQAWNRTSLESQWELGFSETSVDLPAIQAIAGALRRSAIHKLSLHDTGMTSPKCRILTGSAAECEGLTVLAVVEWRSGVPWAIDEEAFAPGSLSNLFLDECMWFGGSSWTDGGAAEFFRQLRTNERQVCISLVELAPTQLRFMEELLTTYNCTLNHLNVCSPSDEWSARIGIALGYGAMAKDACDHLEPSNYQVDMRSLWPLVMDSMMTFPTLLYRFLRRGNVAALADQLSHSPLGRKRPRRSVRIRQKQQAVC